MTIVVQIPKCNRETLVVTKSLPRIHKQKRLLRTHHTTGQGRSEYTRCQSGHQHQSSPGRQPSSGRRQLQGCSPRTCPWRFFQHTAPALQCDRPSSRSPKTNTAPRSQREAGRRSAFLQWLLPDLNRGHRHFQYSPVGHESPSSAPEGVALVVIVASFLPTVQRCMERNPQERLFVVPSSGPLRSGRW